MRKLRLTPVLQPSISKSSLSQVITVDASGHRLGRFSPKDYVSSLIKELYLFFSNV